MHDSLYDDPDFFERYGTMARSRHGLEAAGEWPQFQAVLPSLAGKEVLDLGCGYGWHCRYAAEKGARRVVGIDLSEKMLQVARSLNQLPEVTYLRRAIDSGDPFPGTFDVVISSLAFHYIAGFPAVCRMVRNCLRLPGWFVFSVEHPVFTADGPQRWQCDSHGRRMHWPVDTYFFEGERTAEFLGTPVTKYHRTVTGYFSALTDCGFTVTSLAEPQPDPRLIETCPDMHDELRRPMMLIFAASLTPFPLPGSPGGK